MAKSYNYHKYNKDKNEASRLVASNDQTDWQNDALGIK